ncbi:MAG: hypothetical protein H8D46_00865, partial [FCB group bacterium]|nr:hypothetical protein [FCB group bacterium]
MTFLPAVGLCLGIFTFIIFLVFSIESYREEEHTAFRRGIFTALFLPLPFLLPHAVASPLNSILAGFLIGVTVLILFVLLLPVNSRGFVKAAIPKSRIDERDTMFSRKDLKQGSVQFEEYYSRHPEKLEMDNIFRSHPGLMQKGAALYDPVSASAAEASFKTVKALHNLLDRDRTAV